MRKIYLLLLLAILAVPASATVRYVDTSRPDNVGDGLTWTTAHKHLQSALAAAIDGDQIWVARGIYKPTTNPTDRTASFVMKEGVAIYGGFTSGQMNLNDRNSNPAENSTVLSGDIDSDGTVAGNSFHIIYNVKNELTIRAILDGFTVRGGEDYNYGYGGVQSEGSAMYNEESSPTINRCFFLFNNSTGAGGAIFNKNSSPSISICSFRGNVSGSVGGAVYSNGGSPSIANCDFQFNVTLAFDGGAIFFSNTDSATEIKDCNFEGNVSFYNGGAIYKDGGSLKLTYCSFETNNNKFGRSVRGGAVSNRGSIRIENCNFFKNNTGGVGGALSTSGNDCQILNTTFTQNSASRGGAIHSSGNTQLTNCLFQNNGAFTAGGAMYSSGSPTVFNENIPRFTNCTFLGNSAPEPKYSNEYGGGAIYNFGKGDPQLINCALWGNGGANTFNDGGLNSVVPNVSYTVLDASVTRFGGNGPATFIQITQSPFVSDTNARLRLGSPAIDAGLNSANSTTTDLAGNQRIINGIIDMGAYEFSNPASFAITAVNAVSCRELSATERQLTFTPVYANADGSPIIFSVFGELAETQTPGPYSLQLYKDNPVITLIAKQGNGEQFQYRYDWLATCGTTTPPPLPPPTPGDFAITGVSGVNCETLSPTAKRLTFTPAYRGADGSPITFSVFGELADTQAPGPYSLRLYTDNSSITLFARQSNSERVRFEYDWLAACGTTPPPPPPPAGDFAITGVSGVSCQILSSTARQFTFIPTYQGGDGSPITFSVFGELADTKAPGPYSLRLYTDNPGISLMAWQGSGQTHFQYDWLSVCNNAAARLRVAEEPGSELQLTLLGNPVNDGVVKLEVRGAKGQPLTIQLINIMGRLVAEEHIEQAEAVVSHSFEVGRQEAGVLLLRVSKPGQSQTIKVLNVY